MHPYFTQAIAADRVAEWRSDAAASRRAREDAAEQGRNRTSTAVRRAAHRRARRRLAQIAAERVAADAPSNQPAWSAPQPADDLLVSPEGAGDHASSAALYQVCR